MAENKAVLTEELVLTRARCASVEQVKNLNLWGNDLLDISLVERLPNLEVCSLSVNKIQSLRPFASCSRLRELYLRKNSIRNLEEIDHLAQLPELKVLWLADNPVAELPQYKNYVLGKLPGLQRLDSDLYGGGGAGSQNTGGGAPSARGEGGTATNQLHFVPPPSSARLLGHSGGASSSGAGSALGASGVGGSQSSAATKRPLKQRRSSIASAEQPGSVKKRSAQEKHEALWKNENPHMSTLDSRHMRDMSAASAGKGRVPDHELVLHPNHERRRQQAVAQQPGNMEMGDDPPPRIPDRTSATFESESPVKATQLEYASVSSVGKKLASESPPRKQPTSPAKAGEGEQNYVVGHHLANERTPQQAAAVDDRAPRQEDSRPTGGKLSSASPTKAQATSLTPVPKDDNILYAITALLHEVDADGLRTVIGNCERLLKRKFVQE